MKPKFRIKKNNFQQTFSPKISQSLIKFSLRYIRCTQNIITRYNIGSPLATTLRSISKQLRLSTHSSANIINSEPPRYYNEDKLWATLP